MLWIRRILFVAPVALIGWTGMQGVHELGHVLGAWASGGTVRQVVLDLRTISRTDVMPNPAPGVVVWLGPAVGVLLPLLIAGAIPRRFRGLRAAAEGFAGFCLIANGVYIGLGTFDGVGDAGEMLRTGSPAWVLWLFGIAALVTGLWVWHHLGTISRWGRELDHASWWSIAACWLALAGVMAATLLLTPAA